MIGSTSTRSTHLGWLCFLILVPVRSHAIDVLCKELIGKIYLLPTYSHQSRDADLIESLFNLVELNDGAAPITVSGKHYDLIPNQGSKIADSNHPRTVRSLSLLNRRLHSRRLSNRERQLFKFLVKMKIPINIHLNVEISEAHWNLDNPSLSLGLQLSSLKRGPTEYPSSYQEFLHEAQHLYDAFHSPYLILNAVAFHRNVISITAAQELTANLTAFEGDAARAWELTTLLYGEPNRILLLGYPMGKFKYNNRLEYKTRREKHFANAGLTPKQKINYVLNHALRTSRSAAKAIERAKVIFGPRYRKYVEQQFGKAPELNKIYQQMVNSPKTFKPIYLAESKTPVKGIDEMACLIAAKCPIPSVATEARRMLEQMQSQHMSP